MSARLSLRSRTLRIRPNALPSKLTPGRTVEPSLQPGVQFPDVTLNGRTFHPGQANNFYIYPAVGLASYVARPRRAQISWALTFGRKACCFRVRPRSLKRK